jgi:U4/U6.U5 tri-snRNP-associated protein 1
MPEIDDLNEGEATEEVSLSIEETNKLRAKLGLRPLKIDADDKEKTAEDNFAEYKANQEKERQDAALKEKIEK